MCQTVLWAINAHSFTERFVAETASRLGVAPQDTELRIKSSRVRSSSRHFELVPNMCNCGSLVGLGPGKKPSDGLDPQTLIAWLHVLPSIAEHVSRIAILNCWSPAEAEIVPRRASGIQVSQLAEQTLRSLPGDSLLTIDYR
ncbi:hypothetical protein [Glutamicibacter soli]|uniref:hypothetical protein n=1 Tax=Glutamicibacter soli TaxID=453836 RepID=UPI003FD06816